jgi:Salmonella virulence plasmid 65kDa B protein
VHALSTHPSTVRSSGANRQPLEMRSETKDKRFPLYVYRMSWPLGCLVSKNAVRNFLRKRLANNNAISQNIVSSQRQLTICPSKKDLMNGSDTADTNRVSGNWQTGASPPVLSLPKGGGAIRGIGEKFATNPLMGTNSMTLPLFTTPGSFDFGPQLSLSRDSGAAKVALNIGGQMSLSDIIRRTDKRLAQYVHIAIHFSCSFRKEFARKAFSYTANDRNRATRGTAP